MLIYFFSRNLVKVREVWLMVKLKWHILEHRKFHLLTNILYHLCPMYINISYCNYATHALMIVLVFWCAIITCFSSSDDSYAIWFCANCSENWWFEWQVNPKPAIHQKVIVTFKHVLIIPCWCDFVIQVYLILTMKRYPWSCEMASPFWRLMSRWLPYLCTS